MNKVLRNVMLVLMVSISFFAFSGCTVMPLDQGTTYVRHYDRGIDTGAGSGGGGDDSSSSSSHPDDWPFDTDEFNEDIASYYGVRTLYTPDYLADDYLDSSLPESVLNDRKKYNQNIRDQYKYMAKYILYNLIDHYQTEVSPVDDVYTFYADTTLLPVGETSSMNITYDIVSTIGRQVDVIQNDEWTCRLNEPDSAIYVDTYINAFTPYVQIRLMETVLGVSEPTSINSVVNLSTNMPLPEADVILDNYARTIELLGVPTDVDYDSVIQNDVIGTAAYKVAYTAFIRNVIESFLGDIAANYPVYTRSEFCDLDAANYYVDGVDGDPATLGNMEYNEYQSVTFFYRDGLDPLANIYHMIFFDTLEDITIDVYCMHVEANLGYKIGYLATFHTLANQDFYYTPPDGDDPDYEPDYNVEPTNNNIINQYDTLSLDDRDSDTFLSAYLDPTKETYGTQGYESVLYSHDGQDYGAMMARTSVNSGVWMLPNEVDKNGDMVDLSDIRVYAPLDRDSIVFIFDIQYNEGGTVDSHDDGDYRFKFLIQPSGADSNEMAEDNEDTDDEEDIDDEDDGDDDE